MADGLVHQRQGDFSAGEFRSVAPHLIPPNGAFSLRNFLLDEDGSAYRRGGSVYKSTSGLGTSGLTFLWTGNLGATRRTLIANAADFASMDNAGVLTNIGGAGLAAPAPAVELGGKLHIGGGVTWDGTTLGAAPRTAAVYVVAGNKLISLEGNRAYESAYGDPATFASGDFHELGASAQTITAAGLGDRLLWATTDGVWMISNVELDLIDDLGNALQRLERVYPELLAWGACGVAYWGGAAVLPTLDGLYLVDGISAPRLVSRSIADLWREYVNQGYRPGIAAVHRNHYFLPILSGAAFYKLLVCRLDRPIASPIGEVFPWTHFEEAGGAMAALAEGPDGVLLGAEAAVSSRVARLPYFDPSVANAVDANGAAHSTRVTLRDATTGVGNLNTVVAVEVGYELADPSNDNPTVTASYSSGAQQSVGTQWGAFQWGTGVWSSGGDDTMTAYLGSAPEDPLGSKPYRWRKAVRARRLRVRLDTTIAASKFVLRHVEFLIRQSTRS